MPGVVADYVRRYEESRELERAGERQAYEIDHGQSQSLLSDEQILRGQHLATQEFPRTLEGIRERLENITHEASVGCGSSFYEIYQQRVNDSVNRWIQSEADPAFRGAIQKEATGHYDYDPQPGGRWIPDIENSEVVFRPDHHHLHEAYEAMRTHLDVSLRAIPELRDSAGDLRMDQLLVQRTAIGASQNLAVDRYPATLTDKIPYESVTREEVSVMRKAIMDWSHENNHAIKQKISPAETNGYRESYSQRIG